MARFNKGPRFVRPSFVVLEVDGVKRDIATGPRGIQYDNSQMTATFKVREKGSVSNSVTVESRVIGGFNRLQVIGPEGNVLFTQETEL